MIKFEIFYIGFIVNRVDVKVVGEMYYFIGKFCKCGYVV